MTITVYWAYAPGVTTTADWTVAYNEPERLLSRLHKKRNLENAHGGYLKCPAVTDHISHVYVLTSGVSTGVRMNDDSQELDAYGVTWRQEHAPTLTNMRHVTMELGWHLIADKPLEMLLTAPYFDRTDHLQYGAIMTGKFDIGKWLRPIVAEFQLWSGSTQMHLKENEPFAYIHFLTHEKVVLRQFTATESIHQKAKTNSLAGSWSPKRPLKDRYDRFIRSRTKDVLLREIKDNLL